MMPVLASIFNPFGNFEAEKVIGRSPVAVTRNWKGEPGRTPNTLAPVIFGEAEGVGVRI